MVLSLPFMFRFVLPRQSSELITSPILLRPLLRTPLVGAALSWWWGLACPKYLESYAGGGFEPCSAPFWEERVSHASKVCQGRARLNGSQDVCASTSQRYRQPEGPPLGAVPRWMVWVSGPEDVGEGGLSTALSKHSYPWGLLFKTSSLVGDEVPHPRSP